MELTLETIRAAHARIAPYIVRTPLLRLPALDDALGCAGRRAKLPADPNVGGHAKCAGGLMKEPCAEVLQRYFEKKRKE